MFLLPAPSWQKTIEAPKGTATITAKHPVVMLPIPEGSHGITERMRIVTHNEMSNVVRHTTETTLIGGAWAELA